MLSALEWLILPSLLFFTFSASYFDLKYKKIPNWLIKRIIVVGMVLTLAYLKFFGNFFQVLTYILVSAGIALFLWFIDFWNPGDAKLYVGFALLTPPLSLVPLHPITISLILLAVASFLHSLLRREIKFQPKPSEGMLLPFALLPVFSLFKSPLAIFWFTIFLFFVGMKWAKKMRRLLLTLSLLNLFLFPQNFLSVALIAFVLFLITSIKLEGTLPSAPFLGVSFIYSLLFLIA